MDCRYIIQDRPPSGGLFLYKEEIAIFRIACFIDGGFLNNISEYYGRLRLDYHKLATYMAGNIDILRTYYYHCRPYAGNPPTKEESERQRNFDTFVARIQMLPRFECRFGRLEKRTVGTEVYYEQKRVDVMLAIDLVNLSSKHLITHAAILTGDSDLIPAIQMAKNDGIITHLFYSDIGTSHDLKQVCDEVTHLDLETLRSCCLA